MEKLARFRKYFTVARFWGKLRRFATTAGVKTVYAALLLYYAYERKETPSWAKRAIVGVLGYLVMPLDFVPDLTPLVGYTDDLGFLSLGIAMVAAYINDGVRVKARTKLTTWFPNVTAEELAEVDAPA